MLYKPSTGRFKDGYIIWHEGVFYLFSMFGPGPEDQFRSVWLASSDDGVHWKHVGPVIENAPFNIWAMAVHRAGGRFIMNHGSFSRPGVQNILRFWESSDLVHWKYLGRESEVTPDPRWHDPNGRLDCMAVLCVTEDGRERYYGYATGPGGFLRSDDGIKWEGMPSLEIDWGEPGPPPMQKDEGFLEIGGCERINGRFYLVGGWFNYLGFTGYNVFTLVSDNPTGPFRPDPGAYRLCGNSRRWVSLWARFCRTDSELLVNGYMYDGHTYESGQTWLPPLKRAIVDAGGSLRLGYWRGNDAIKGEAIPIDLARTRPAFPSAESQTFKRRAALTSLELEIGPEQGSILRAEDPIAVVTLEAEWDFDKGIVLEGTVKATCRDKRLASPGAGFLLEEKPGEGTAIWLQGFGLTQIGSLAWSDRVAFTFEDVVIPGGAAKAGIAPHIPHAFRLFARRNMFEFYLDDRLVQTFNTSHVPGVQGLTPRRIGFLAQNGSAIFENLRAWQMNLE